MKARWLRAILVVALGVGVLGIGAWRVSNHRGDSATDPELGTVFVTTGSKQPESCDDVSMQRSSVGLFAAAASGDGYDVTVKVVDSILSSSAFETPYTTVTRDEPQMLRLVVTASGAVESQRKSYANEVLRHAKLERVGDPTSLTVDWPSGLKQQASGIPWRTSGEVVDRMYRYESDADVVAPTEFRLYASVAVDPPTEDRSVHLSWTKVDPLTGPGIGWGYFTTGLLTDVKSANKVIDGYLLTVVTS